MARRRGDTHRLIRWLWTSRRVDARLARAALLPLAGLWRLWMGVRVAGFRLGWVKVHDLPLPSVAVGNLTVGGSGKTPVAIWVAQYYAGKGLAPGVLLRGYGGDEALVHSKAVPSAHVVSSANRVEGAERALARGAQVLVLDDAYQRLDIRRDLNILVISAETTRAVRWPLPGGSLARRVVGSGPGGPGHRDPETGNGGSGAAARGRASRPGALSGCDRAPRSGPVGGSGQRPPATSLSAVRANGWWPPRLSRIRKAS